MKPFRLGQWAVYPAQNAIERGLERRTLEPRQMDVLMRLAEAGGDVVTKEQLLCEVWDDRYVVEHVVPKTISALRRALGESARRPMVIQTVARRGYRLACDISELADRGRVARRIERLLPTLRLAAAAALGGITTSLAFWYGAELPRRSVEGEHLVAKTTVRLAPRWEFSFATATVGRDMTNTRRPADAESFEPRG